MAIKKNKGTKGINKGKKSEETKEKMRQARIAYLNKITGREQCP